MKHSLLFLIILATVILIPNAFAQEQTNIPSWIKNNAEWWASDQIPDSAFLQGIEYLINEGIMIIHSTELSGSSESQGVPVWIKNTAGWWADGQIDDSTFISGIQWLISNGIIVVEEKLIHTDADFRVAFIGDQGLGPNAVSVLNLIKDEGAQMVLHQGDLDYEDDPDKWERQISDVLGSDFPYFVSIGSHDVLKWNEYQQKLHDRLKKNPDVQCVGDLGVKSSCTYKGLLFIQVGPGLKGSGHSLFIENQLNDNDHVWSICSWALNMGAMQIAGDPRLGTEDRDETGWEVYTACKNGGAIIATAHEHSYQRTKTLIDIKNQIVDSEWPEPGKLRIKEGSTFVFVSGVGGQIIRDQDRCLPFFYPHGCNGEWASIYTADQWATSGALFCTFNVGGQPNKAYCYFKNIDERIIDAFTVTSLLGTYSDNSNLIDTDMSGWNLAGDDFSNTVITDVNLSNAILIGADLSSAVIIGTTLTGADLTGANLAGVTLIGNDLTGTILRGADLTGANLFGVDLSDIDLTGTTLTGADLTGTNLAGVTLIGNDLTGTILRGINLTGVNLAGVDLSGRDLAGATLRGLDLTDENLTGTILRGADLTGADLAGVDLSVMDLTYANLSGQDLSDHDLTDVILTGTDLSNSLLPDNGLSGKNFTGTIFNGVDLSGKSLYGSIVDCIINTSGLPCVNFVDTNLENANLSRVSAINSDFTEIKNKSLEGTNLARASLAFSNLLGVSLAGANLLQTNFNGANLSGMDFTVHDDAMIDGMRFVNSNLSNSNFEGVDMTPKYQYRDMFNNKGYLVSDTGQSPESEAMIKKEFFRAGCCQIISAVVSGNDLIVKYFVYTLFVDANLENANFKNADLEFVNFYYANLTNANLSGADLRNTNLINANLSGADLRNANLEGANLEGAILDNAMLSNANLKCNNHPICNS